MHCNLRPSFIYKGFYGLGERPRQAACHWNILKREVYHAAIYNRSRWKYVKIIYLCPHPEAKALHSFSMISHDSSWSQGYRTCLSYDYQHISAKLSKHHGTWQGPKALAHDKASCHRIQFLCHQASIKITEGCIFPATLNRARMCFSESPTHLDTKDEAEMLKKVALHSSAWHGPWHGPWHKWHSKILDIQALSYPRSDIRGHSTISGVWKLQVSIRSFVNDELPNGYKMFRISKLATWDACEKTTLLRSSGFRKQVIKGRGKHFIVRLSMLLHAGCPIALIMIG
jgi:hypothetical protein